ncbi:MAG: cation diffusion facilitator family transporter [Thermoleophilia bacterium]
MSAESRTTVLVALGANLGIAVAKGVAAVLTGSAALLAETAHSLADTVNQVLLLVSISLGKRPADEEHPLGYGRDRFFWALLVAVLIFVVGGLVSVGRGVLGLLGGGEGEGFVVAYAILGVSLVLESASLARAVRQTRRMASREGLGFWTYARHTTDPTVNTVLFEDTAAVIGLLLALGGVGLHQATGSAVWDAVGAIAIGALLLVVAFLLGRDSRDLLLGEPARPDELAALRSAILAQPEVAVVTELVTTHVGPDELVVAVRAELRRELPGAEVERLRARIRDELAGRVGDVSRVFVELSVGEPPSGGVSRSIRRGRPAG